MKLRTTNYELRTGETGFSLIELLIAVAIIAVIAILIATPLYQAQKRQALNAAVDDVLELIKEARGNTLAARDDSVFGVHFETERAVLFKGSTFTEGAADNKEVELDSRVEISEIDLAGGSDDVIFRRLSGETKESGTVVISLIDDSASSTIRIRASGVVELE